MPARSENGGMPLIPPDLSRRDKGLLAFVYSFF